MKVNDFVYEIFTTAQTSSICGIPVIRRLTPTLSQHKNTYFALIQNNPKNL